MNKLKRIDKKTRENMMAILKLPGMEHQQSPSIGLNKEFKLDKDFCIKKIKTISRVKEQSVADTLLSSEVEDEEVAVYVNFILENENDELLSIRDEIIEKLFVSTNEIDSLSSSIDDKLYMSRVTKGIERHFNLFPESRLGFILRPREFAMLLEGNDGLENTYALALQGPFNIWEMLFDLFKFLLLLVAFIIFMTILNSI